MKSSRQLGLIAGALNPGRRELEGDELALSIDAALVEAWLERYTCEQYPDHADGDFDMSMDN